MPAQDALLPQAALKTAEKLLLWQKVSVENFHRLHSAGFAGLENEVGFPQIARTH
jgi:hypothetical protein